MFSCLIITFVAMVLSCLVMSIGVLLSKKTIQSREKSTSFECGFDPVKTGRLPFSLRFFLLAIIFLVFDVEIVLLFPMLQLLSTSGVSSCFLACVLFLMILLFGVLYEWKEGSLDWIY